jgi:hypothetical protein
MGRVFVHEETDLDLSFAAARQAVPELVRGGLLLNASRAAYGDGITGRARVGPVGSVRGLSRLVRVDLGDPIARRDSTHLPLRWEATGPGSSLFPALDADIVITPAGDRGTRLTIDGVYRAPMGTIGAGLDQAVLSRIAAATIRDFASRVAMAINALAAGTRAAGQASDQGRAAEPPPASLLS